MTIYECDGCKKQERTKDGHKPKIQAEPALMTRWLKGAEPVFKDGRLIPWEPPEVKS